MASMRLVSRVCKRNVEYHAQSPVHQVRCGWFLQPVPAEEFLVYLEVPALARHLLSEVMMIVGQFEYDDRGS